ncbi:putative WRKY transcription factor 50 [Zea mays]|uniref:Putative WRKY transcription factor 50 n=1 Tax=Zea mays TaxID=4577 RepID=A0A3L6FD42_MAIZE|nr:putative WRKY transcription factor 50 [Zea mays]
MAASLGLAHETSYAAYHPPSAPASSYFPPPPPPPPDLVADLPPPAAATMADDYFQFGFDGQEMVGAPAPACGGYDCSEPVFANSSSDAAVGNGMSLLSYGVDGDGDRRRPMSGPPYGTGGNCGGRPPPSSRIGFRTRSEVDVLDDGFKWRKYGKKAVKSSPNPRNYYRCSAEGCGVKKRVERDSDDPRYVVTTYDGVHNHAAPGPGPGAASYLCQPPPPRGATATATPFSPPRSASAPAPSWSAACDAWEAQLHAAAAAAHSSESSY